MLTLSTAVRSSRGLFRQTGVRSTSYSARHQVRALEPVSARQLPFRQGIWWQTFIQSLSSTLIDIPDLARTMSSATTTHPSLTVVTTNGESGSHQLTLADHKSVFFRVLSPTYAYAVMHISTNRLYCMIILYDCSCSCRDWTLFTSDQSWQSTFPLWMHPA